MALGGYAIRYAGVIRRSGASSVRVSMVKGHSTVIFVRLEKWFDLFFPHLAERVIL